MDLNIIINIQDSEAHYRKQLELWFWTSSGQSIFHCTTYIMNKWRGPGWRIKQTKGGQKHWSDDILTLNWLNYENYWDHSTKTHVDLRDKSKEKHT